MELKQQYENPRKKYRLPDFEGLDKDFEISLIEESNFSLRAIRNKMAEKIDSFVSLLDGLLHPNTDLSSLYELTFFEDEEKEKIFELYKKIMVLSRTALELSLENDEKKDAEFINSTVVEWGRIKKELGQIIEKLKNSWSKKEDERFRLEYLG